MTADCADSPRGPAVRHRPLPRLLHWSVFLLVLVATAAILTRCCVGDSFERKQLLCIHQSAGLAVLGLMLVRVVWRAIALYGATHTGLPRAMRIGAPAVHPPLYVTLFPLT